MKCYFLILFTVCTVSANAQQEKPPLFTLLSPKQIGINFSNDIRESEAENVLAYEYLYNGGGVAIGDINNDGLPDIYFTANLRQNRLYLNLGNCTFKDITRQAGVGGRGDWRTGVTMADVNGDDLLDIYVCYSGKGSPESRRNELYINNGPTKGGITFTERAHEYSLDDAGCSTQAVFFDYDIDGDLDMYLLNHNTKAFKNVELHYLKNDYDSLAADKLYRNDDGHFTDVSRQAGISGNPISFGLGVAVSDINNDGWPDIYVSNDYSENDYLYINNANGTFTERSFYMLSHLSQFSMGSDIADINNDGLVDIFTLDMLPEDNRRQKLLQSQENYELYQTMVENGFHYQFMRNMLHLNNGNGTFSEIGQLAGISNTDWSWSALFADFDNDGYKDLYITNGYMRDYTNKDFLKFWGDYLIKQAIHRDSIRYLDIVQQMPSTMTRHYSFRNNPAEGGTRGGITFTNTSAAWGLDQLVLSNGASYADLDNDGDLDIIVNNINAPASVYRNESNTYNKNHYLDVRLAGIEKNRAGIGAKIYCYANGIMQLLEQMPVRGYQSSVSPVLHFGLGTVSLVDSLKVIWLNGRTQTFKNIPANQVITLNQQPATENYFYNRKVVAGLFTAVKPILDYTHVQPAWNDFKRQPLMPVMLSQCGPRLSTADVNGDGLEDIFIGGSEGQSSTLYLQQPDGRFVISNQQYFNADSNSTTSAIIFFDANGDKFLDIYCVSGGYNDYEENDGLLQDRLYINDGKGNFSVSIKSLPAMHVSKSCVAAADIDKDGDIDLFVGGRLMPGQYPAVPRSYLLINDGQGHFVDSTPAILQQPGMITDAKWCDLNKDGYPELIIVGEWMSPTIYDNIRGQLQTSIPQPGTRNFKLETYSGWWNTLELADIDGDGDTDIIAGNWGLNSQLQASEQQPAEMIYKDFDNNGSIDPILCYYIQGKSYPYISRDELLDQLYSMRRKFTSYKSYADAVLADLFTDAELKDAMKLAATHFETTVFENRDGQFLPKALPIQAQYAPVYKILVQDINGDKYPDLLLFGNNDYPRLKMGKIDANFGIAFINDGHGNFNYLPQQQSGLRVVGDVKDVQVLQINSVSYLLIAATGMPLQWYKLNMK